MRGAAALVSSKGPYSTEAVEQAARELREQLGAAAALGMAFCSADYLGHCSEFCEILRVEGHIVDIVGCASSRLIHGEEEQDSGMGFTVLALGLAGVGASLVVDAALPSRRQSCWLALASPEMLNVEAWVLGAGNSPVVGGIASASLPEAQGSVFLNGQFHECVAVEISAPTQCVPVLCQGCRPIGEPLTVTRAESNVIYALGAQPAYQALESAFETLSEEERTRARGNLFAGLAGSEYIEDYQAGDFLVRHILGADPNSGAVAIAGIPRIGQTLQYQLRDPLSAISESQRVLKTLRANLGKPRASLLFSCTARGQEFFGVSGHDAGTVQKILGSHPSAGLSCAGEFAPLCGHNGVHSHSLVCAAFY